MASYSINWSLIGQPVDIGGAVQAGYQRGREQRLQRQQESAFALLARDPNSAEGRALLTESGRPDLARQFRQWGREDRRDEVFRSAFSPAGAAPTATTPAPGAMPSAFAAPASPDPVAAPAAMAPGAAAPASQAPGQLNMALVREYAAEDPDGARELITTWNAMNDAQRAQVTRQYAAAVPILAEVARMPLAERGVAVMSQADYLISAGWTQEQLQAFAQDPNDQTIRMLLRRGVPIAEQREFFEPNEAAPGTIARDPITGRVVFANPSQPRSEVSYDANGNEIIASIPGTPALGVDAGLFGSGVQGPQVAPALPQPGAVVNGHRYRGPAVTDPSDPALRDRNNWEPVQGGPSRQDSGYFRGRPVADGAAVVSELFPGARVTDGRRSASSRLGRANPRSWHVQSGGAVDVRPIPGMTFAQYVRRIRQAGYEIIEQRDEVTNPSSHATGPHWHVVIGQRGS